MGVHENEPERQARTPPSIARGTSRSPKSKTVLFHFGDIPHRVKGNLWTHWNLSDGDLVEILSSRNVCSGPHPWVFPTVSARDSGYSPSPPAHLCTSTTSASRSLQQSHISPPDLPQKSRSIELISSQAGSPTSQKPATLSHACSYTHFPLMGTKGLCTRQVLGDIFT